MFPDLSRVICVFASVALLTGCKNERNMGRIEVHKDEKAVLAVTASKNHTAWRLIFKIDPAAYYSTLKDADAVAVHLENADSSPLAVSGIPGINGLHEIAPGRKIEVYHGPLSRLIRPEANAPERFVLESTLMRNVRIKLFLEFHLSGTDYYAVCVDLYHGLEGP